MDQPISLEQGDINVSELRKEYFEQLDSRTKNWIAEDAKYFLHQALSTPVMNVLGAVTSISLVEVRFKLLYG